MYLQANIAEALRLEMPAEDPVQTAISTLLAGRLPGEAGAGVCASSIGAKPARASRPAR